MKDAERKLIKDNIDNLKSNISELEVPIKNKELPDEDDFCELSVPIQFIEEAYKIEDELEALGMSGFDTAAGFGYRIWQIDFPLKSGATARQIVSYVKEHHPRFYELATIGCWSKNDEMNES